MKLEETVGNSNKGYQNRKRVRDSNKRYETHREGTPFKRKNEKLVFNISRPCFKTFATTSGKNKSHNREKIWFSASTTHEQNQWAQY